MNWIYKRKEMKSLNDFPTDIVGFVYKITNLETGKFYIGKKILFNTRKTTISKREKLATGTRKKFKKVVKESNWKVYYGSSKDLTEDIKLLGKQKFKREIIELSFSKKHLGYCEMKHQILNKVLEIDSYNGNILSRYFKNDLIKNVK